MSIFEVLNNFLKRRKMNLNKDSDPTESHSGSSSQSRILDIKRAESAKMAAQIQHTERLCATQKAQNDAVLKRLGFSVPHDTLPSAQPQASRRSPESSLGGRRIRLISEDDKRGRESRTNRTLQEENPNPFLKKKLYLGSQMKIPSCKLAMITEEDRSPSPDSSISSVDMQTPRELRAISQFTLTPPPTAATRRPTRLPVMTVKPGQAKKDVADGCKLQTAQSKVEKFMERLDKFQLLHHPSPQPPAAPGRTQAVTAKVRLRPALHNRSQPHCAVKPTVPAPPVLPNKRGPHRGPQPYSEKADTGQEDLQPLVNPAKSLSLCFKQLTSDDWEKNLDGLKSVRALARHHPALLQTKLHEVCLILIKVVNNLRSSVASSALDTVGELHVHLGRAMDAEAEWTGRALLLKLSKTTNVFVRQRANLALDALVEGCGPGRVMSVLFNTGLSHTYVAVRESTAQHLQQLVDVVGVDQILTSGKIFRERFLTAISKMVVDAAPKVRRHGQMMIQGIYQQRKLIPEKYLRPVQKILQKARQ